MTAAITLEQLAQMVQRGFEQTATKEDLGGVDSQLESLRAEMERRFEQVDNRFLGVDRRLDSIDMEVREIKVILGPLVRTVAGMEVDIHDLQSRVRRLEKKTEL